MAESTVNNEGLAGDSQGLASPHGHGHRRHPWHFHFSEEELHVFRECKRESIIYRALPLAAVFGALTFAAMKYGFLSPNARLGAIPKVTLAVLVGYGVGKASYRKTCMKKMMDLPNSHFGQYLREKRENPRESWGFPSREGMMMFEAGGNPRDFYWGPRPTEPSASPKSGGAPIALAPMCAIMAIGAAHITHKGGSALIYGLIN